MVGYWGKLVDVPVVESATNSGLLNISQEQADKIIIGPSGAHHSQTNIITVRIQLGNIAWAARHHCTGLFNLSLQVSLLVGLLYRVVAASDWWAWNRLVLQV